MLQAFINAHFHQGHHSSLATRPVPTESNSWILYLVVGMIAFLLACEGCSHFMWYQRCERRIVTWVKQYPLLFITSFVMAALLLFGCLPLLSVPSTALASVPPTPNLYLQDLQAAFGWSQAHKAMYFVFGGVGFFAYLLRRDVQLNHA